MSPQAQMVDRAVFVARTELVGSPESESSRAGDAAPEARHSRTFSRTDEGYAEVQRVLGLAGLDERRYGTPDWNPFGDLVWPGERVMVKPNLVKQLHPRYDDGWETILTDSGVIRAVCDYVWKALGGRGTVLVADAPQTDSSFTAIAKVLGLDVLRDDYRERGFDFQLVDLRREEWESRDGVVPSRKILGGDPVGYCAYDLGNSSDFSNHHGAGRYYGADYDTTELNRHHSLGKHEYLLSGSAIQADVIFSLPKLKTHKKAGITGALKNLVGINGDKNWLPHHTEGTPETGGDERPDSSSGRITERNLVRQFRRINQNIPVAGPMIHRLAKAVGKQVFGDTEEVIRSGNWYGNDTIWRMCLDLNKALSYGNADGTLRPGIPENRKRHYVLVDGIIAGEGRGPMNPDPVPAGVVLFGTNPASVDAACAVLMGFDPEKIPIVRNAFRCRDYPLAEWGWEDVRMVSNVPAWNALLPDIPHESTFHFEPHFGWKGHIERSRVPTAV